MRNIKFLAAAVVASVGIIVACQKENSTAIDPPKTANIAVDRSVIKPGETVSFTVQNGTVGGVARWSVIPNTNVAVNRSFSWDQKNTITFNQAGTYAVSAEIKKVWCDSAAAANPGMDTCLNSGTVTGQATTTIVVKN